MEKICVAVRVRPPVATFQEASNGNHWRIEDNHISLRKSDGTPISGVSHAFDHMFDESCTNARVYELLTKDIIHAAVEGFNGTAFAYGQTSSGKTFTMNGSETDPGIIHRAVKEVFNRIQMISDREFLIRVSYMEIYNEEINDLFAVENQKLQIHESLERGIFVAGLREEIVNNAEQVLNLIASGEVNRHFGETNMNVRSSRSHTIFRMVIESKGKDTVSSTDYPSSDAIRVSVLNLVDLAGSERIAKTGAGGVRLKEGKHINKSLMALGNVINKLSDGVKHRGHIPYRDSKLTRILQPALGGNAKTSIICTIAPEEVHIEETKGTLQFASRAKRITNCAQVNEILTDAALLKRQKLEIEELRNKLQGSRAEVFEQEILKLRNEMLKYELEREKLETQLEEERRSQKEREQYIREQQMKIDNLSSLGQNSWGQNSKEEFNDSNSRSQGDVFKTPSFKAAPNGFVARRSDYSRLSDYSPLPDTLSNIADEDTWLKMNKGYIADLDLIQNTPARKVKSLPSTDTTPVSLPSSDTTPGSSNDNSMPEVENLKRQLELVTKEKNDIEKKHLEQLSLNDHLMGEMSELKQQVLVAREIPQNLCKTVTSCKDLYKDILLRMQTLVPDDESSTAKLLCTTNEIGINLFSNLESYFLMTKDDHETFKRNDPLVDHETFRRNDPLVQEECKLLSERLKATILSLAALEKTALQNKEAKNRTCRCGHKGSTQEGETASFKDKPSNELDSIKDKYYDLEKKLNQNNQLLENCREKYATLERDFQLVKEERDSLLERVSQSSQRLAFVTDQKENILRDLNTEARKRKDLEEEIKQFSVAFGSRHRLLTSFQSEFKSKIEKLRAPNPVSVPKSLGC